MLTVDDLEIGFSTLHPLAGVDFSVARGEILGLVGESGSGKSMTAMSVMGLLPLIGGRVTRGSIRFEGEELTTLDEARYRRLRGGRIALITQNPMTSLDPMVRVGPQIDQGARLHLGLDARAARIRTVELMARMRIPDAARVYDLHPHQLSGGLRQRIVIAMALAGDPELLIADEPTTALDVIVQAQIVQLLVELVRERDLALMLITHDMGLVAQACDRVAVMYSGRIVESGPVAAIFEDPRHPYTRALIGCIPRPGMAEGTLAGIPGTVPSIADLPSGCRFHPRCPMAVAACRDRVPQTVAVAADHGVACLLAGAASGDAP
ncbi:ABC transporter ATP-binding protein [Siculibacillus lacustris]|uniref:ABC transporter ATP-binding protein n=1 Tax=Siculibacillus lacustris TaxID=1549641 RepID=A0A4Q9VNS0_9HYPH|nr:ABC transporter ATP-binding protein [Siculibacillus lacustris]TBW36808.1 ABC transporter ATP-binding protein [Siculibacillus lacustris]